MFTLSYATTQLPHMVKTLWIAPNFVGATDGLLLADFSLSLQAGVGQKQSLSLYK